MSNFFRIFATQRNEEMNILKKIFLNEHAIMAVILLNAVVIYLQIDGYEWPWLLWVDLGCTLVFLVEMLVKFREYGLKAYWRDGWNKLDGTLVILSLPSLLSPFISVEGAGMSVLLVLRLLRVLKFFRVMHFFPNFGKIVTGFKLAMRESWAVLASFAVIILIFGLINCSLFKELAPMYFGTPLDSIYSVFRMFTIEGWYEIPDTVAAAISMPVMAHVVRLYFCLLLIGGGIIGMSFINSVFVDAMAEDNNDDVKYQLTQLEKKIDRLMKELEEKK